MGRNRTGTSKSQNDQVTSSDAKFLQRRLYNACHEALNQAELDGKTSPALLQAVHRIIQDSGVRVSALDDEMSGSLYSLADRISQEDGFAWLETETSV